MDHEAEAAQRRLALELAEDVIGHGDALERRAEHELPRMQHELSALGDHDLLGEVRLGQRRVDVGVRGVAEDPEARAKAHVDRSRLDVLHVERLDDDAAGGHLGLDVAV